MIDPDETAQLIAKRLHSGKYWTIIEADDIRFADDIKRKFYSGERSSGFESVASPSGNFTVHFARKDWLSGTQLSSAMDERLLGVVESRESNVLFPCIPGYESRVWEVANAFVDFIAPHYREADGLFHTYREAQGLPAGGLTEKGVLEPDPKGDTFPEQRTSFVETHVVLFVAILLLTGVTVTVVHMSNLAKRLTEEAALENAVHYSDALSEFRALYTAEVVNRVIPLGIEVTHDYETKEGAIPLPATLAMALGKRIGEKGSGAQTRLYSAYPFPGRENYVVPDSFEEAAWEYLNSNRDKPYYSFTEYEGASVLRYATADLMQTGCVSCHNSHPQSPKTDWKEGDVRGILEVILPVDTNMTVSKSGLARTFVFMILITLFGVVLFAVVVYRLQRSLAHARGVAGETHET